MLWSKDLGTGQSDPQHASAIQQPYHSVESRVVRWRYAANLGPLSVLCTDSLKHGKGTFEVVCVVLLDLALP